MSVDEYYELLQLAIIILGMVTIILAFVYIGYEKGEETERT
jgi:hypothetical protein